MPKTRLKIAKDPDARKWWESLSKGHKDEVREWIYENPPNSQEWFENGWTHVDWAYTEMPHGFFTGRPGKIL